MDDSWDEFNDPGRPEDMEMDQDSQQRDDTSDALKVFFMNPL